jgi:hypothetical protein
LDKLKKQVIGLKNIEAELKDMLMKKEEAGKDLTLFTLRMAGSVTGLFACWRLICG